MGNSRYDLQDRLIEFGVMVCAVCEEFPATQVGNHVAGQLVRSSTSPLANYGESQGMTSRKEFLHRLSITLRELRETAAWLRFAAKVGLCGEGRVNEAMGECDELCAIVYSSIRTTKRRR